MIKPPLKTVRVKNPNFPDGVLINAEDFNPETDTLFAEAATPRQPAPDKPLAK